MSLGRSRSPTLVGDKFGRLLPTTQIIVVGKRTAYECVCDCGNTRIVSHYSLTSENTKSCGCLAREKIANRNKANATHGHSNSNEGRPTPTFTSWVNMIQRCTNPKHKSFPRYGGRGIEVCERWFSSFENFLADMGVKPKSLEIDRTDNSKGYSPENCEWATRVQNANNRDVNHVITHAGRTQNIKEWAVEIGCSHQTIAYRLKHGWSVDDALTTPVNPGNAWKRGTR